GASLLVYAHARVNDAALRRKTAIDLSAGVLDLVKESSSGRDEAPLVGDRVGYRSEIFHGPIPEKSPNDEADNTVVVPLEDGYAVVNYGEARVSPVIGVYALVALLAAACAALLGSRIGGLFTEDLWLATQGVR